MTITELEPRIVQWGRDKDLIQHTQAAASAQHGKTVEEVGELLESISVYEEDKQKYEEGWILSVGLRLIALEAGDVLVTLVLQSAIVSDKGQSELSKFLADDLTGVYKNRQRHSLADYLQFLEQWLNLDHAPMAYNKQLRICRMALLVQNAIAPYDLTLDECLTAAWEKIRDLKGQTINGVFVKAEDLPA